VLFLSYSIILSFPSTAKPQITMAQTLEQRKRNAKFAKTQEARMGKSEEQLQKKVKTIHKSPISMFWMVILGFIIFGGLIFELLTRFFG